MLTHIKSSGKVKAGALWGKSKDDLKKQLVDLKGELSALRTQKITGGAQSKLNKMYESEQDGDGIAWPQTLTKLSAVMTFENPSPVPSQSSTIHNARNCDCSTRRKSFCPLIYGQKRQEQSDGG